MSGGLTWARLREVSCAELEGAADGWGKASNRADAARDRIDKQLLAGLTASQEGEAARAAVGRLRALGRNFQYIYTECGLVRTTLNSLAQDLRGPQRQLQDALDEAAGLGFTVRPDGAVSYPEAGEDPYTKEKLRGGTASGHAYLRSASPAGFTSPNPLAAKAQGIADRIARALGQAAEIDARYTETLRKLTARDGLKVTAAMWADASGDAAAVRALTADYLRAAIPHDATPVERRAWWRGLTAEQREEYLAVHPDLIGNLDGIPAAVRDAANRDNLALLMGKLEGAEDDRSRTMLAGLRSIDGQLRAGGHPPVFLLGIGDEGNGRAIVSYGNPDTARNVSAYVPGLGTGLDEGFAEDDLKRARDTWMGAQEANPDSTSASIVWLGYDAPQISASDIPGSSEVMFTGKAETGASAYNGFMSGIAATNQHGDPHLTAIGHSYGSLTVGQAAQQPHGIPGVDDIILLGSPGTGADSADDLGVGKSHVFVGAAQNDPVTWTTARGEAQGMGMGALGGASAGAVLGGPVGAAVGGLGGAAAGYFAQDAQTDESERWFGTDPAHADFGAQRFKVADGAVPIVGGDGFTPGHSNYFDPTKDQLSADNIAIIVSGRPGDIKRETYR